MDKEPGSVLDRKHVNRMLVHILKVGEVGSMDFSWLTTNWRIIDENLGMMVDSGILQVRIPSKGRKTLRYSLTEMGRCVAIIELLQEECVKGRFDLGDDIIHDDILGLWENGGKLRRMSAGDESPMCCRKEV